MVRGPAVILEPVLCLQTLLPLWFLSGIWAGVPGMSILQGPAPALSSNGHIEEAQKRVSEGAPVLHVFSVWRQGGRTWSGMQAPKRSGSCVPGADGGLHRG